MWRQRPCVISSHLNSVDRTEGSTLSNDVIMTSLSSYHDIAIEVHYISLCSDGRLKAGDVVMMIDGKIAVDLNQRAVEAVLELSQQLVVTKGVRALHYG